tara:strand:- start:659 stop:1168 length:510 start_codon:yes stop_codon:yes gene_type:complete
MKNDFKYYAFLHGAYLGFGLMILATLFYVYDSVQLLPTWTLYSVIYIIVLFTYSICAVLIFCRKKINSRYIFKQYFTISFLILAVALFFSKMHMFILYNIVDSNLLLDYADYTYSKHQMDIANYSFEQWFSVIKVNFKLLNQLQEYVFSLIPCTLYSAIISLLMKFNYN